MTPEMREAIEQARDIVTNSVFSGVQHRPISLGRAVYFLRRFAEEMPSEMTLGDVAEELSNNEMQREAL